MREQYRLNKDIFIERCNKIHNNKYDYSKVEYINQRTKVCIICPIHGEFFQTPKNHMKGQGCSICGAEYAKRCHKYGFNNFIDESNKRFNQEYDFPNIENEYENSHSKITIIHKKCGTQFNKIACDHITSPLGGCPHCFNNISKPETDMFNYTHSLLDDNDVITSNDRTILNNNEIDILVKNLNVGFELNGLYWHNELHKDKNYHVNKLEQCLNNGIKLLQFYEDEWYLKQDIVKSMISNVLHKNNCKIYARKCEIKEVSFNESKTFLNDNHIQGFCVSKYRYGLYYNNELVSLMTFGSLRKNLNGENKNDCYELLRFCNKLDTTVIGGASKLFKHFINSHNPNEITSYCDRRFYCGETYKIMGFELSHISKPSYFYHIKSQRVNRFALRKDILIKDYSCPKDMSEHDFCLSKGWYRIYDCGCLCYKWAKKQ